MIVFLDGRLAEKEPTRVVVDVGGVGYEVQASARTLRNLKDLTGPQFLHVVTRKGKGYPPAEAKPVTFHGVSAFDPATGKMERPASQGPTYTQVFGDWICDMAAEDDRLVGITPAMREGSGLVRFSEQFPDRYYDVGIAEQHSVTLAAGLACEGLKPVVAIYSTFLQRAYDQVVHDVALQNLPVLFAVDRGGLVGPDGPTHAGSFDLSFLRCIELPEAMADWSLTSLQLKLIKIGARVVRHARAITFQLAEVAVTGPMGRAVLAAIRRRRTPPSCA